MGFAKSNNQINSYFLLSMSQKLQIPMSSGTRKFTYMNDVVGWEIDVITGSREVRTWMNVFGVKR